MTRDEAMPGNGGAEHRDGGLYKAEDLCDQAVFASTPSHHQWTHCNSEECWSVRNTPKTLSTVNGGGLEPSVVRVFIEVEFVVAVSGD